jgi:hypothetical protein
MRGPLSALHPSTSGTRGHATRADWLHCHSTRTFTADMNFLERDGQSLSWRDGILASEVAHMKEHIRRRRSAANESKSARVVPAHDRPFFFHWQYCRAGRGSH